MTTAIVLLAVAALGAALVRYARHDRFAGHHSLPDELRLARDLSHFVPR